MDLSLFDVTALAKDTMAHDRIPVTVSFARGAEPSTPTGLTLTSTSGSPVQGASARGYATAESGTDVSRLLQQRIAADVQAGLTPGTTPLFPGVATVGRTDATTGSPAAKAGPSGTYTSSTSCASPRRTGPAPGPTAPSW